jgi:hypothetical protein
MARIRTIKPEFWCDEKLSPLSAIDRLTFLGLISMADDYGRVHDNVKIIDAFIFPNTDESVRESLANLSRIIRIKRGKSSQGMPIIEIVNWDKHQKVDKPQPKLALPPIDSKTIENTEETSVRESFANNSRTARELVAPHTPTPTNDQGPRPGTNDLGIDDKSPMPNTNKQSSVQKTPPSVDDVRRYMVDQGYSDDADAFVDFYSANGWVQGRGKPIKDWQAAVRNWQRTVFSKPPGASPPVTFAQQRLANTAKAIEEFSNG